MKQDNKIISIALVVLLGVFLQILFFFMDTQVMPSIVVSGLANVISPKIIHSLPDSPNKAVIELVQAYYCVHESMANRICKDDRVNEDEVDLVKKYVYNRTKEAGSRGYSMFIMQEKLYDLQTYMISKDHEKAQIRLTCERKPPLKAFFTGEAPKKVDKVFDLVKEDGKWKACGNVFSTLESNG